MDKQDENNKDGDAQVSRRDFTALSVAAGLTASTGVASAAMALTESDVSIKTPDGVCDAAFIRPASGKHPAVLIWTDIFGLRPSMRAMARRLAGEGYAVLVPNPFYRTQKAPVVTDELVDALMGLGYRRVEAEGAAEAARDAVEGLADQLKFALDYLRK